MHTHRKPIFKKTHINLLTHTIIFPSETGEFPNDGFLEISIIPTEHRPPPHLIDVGCAFLPESSKHFISDLSNPCTCKENKKLICHVCEETLIDPVTWDMIDCLLLIGGIEAVKEYMNIKYV